MSSYMGLNLSVSFSVAFSVPTPSGSPPHRLLIASVSSC